MRQAGPLAALLAGVIVLGAACSSSPGTGSTNSADNASSGGQGNSSGQNTTNSYAACMRSHGVPKFPNPNSSGQYAYGPGSGINPDSPQFQAATRDCANLIPQGSNGQPSNAGSGAGPDQQAQQQFEKYGECMLSHGVAGFPVPGTSNSGVQVKMPTTINPNSPTFQNAQTACQSLMPGGGPGYGG